MTKMTTLLPEAWDFAPGILAIEAQPPSPLPRLMFYLLFSLVAILLAWATLGTLDIIASAEGRLVPETYLKIVQPAEAGIVREILVNEGARVEAGAVLLRLDTALSKADTKILEGEITMKSLQLRRIAAELNGTALQKATNDPSEFFTRVEAQYRAHRQAHADAEAQAQAELAKAREDLGAAMQVLRKLKDILPAYRAEEAAWTKLGQSQLAGSLQVLEKQRERIEKEQDLKAQERTVQSFKATLQQAEKHLAQIESKYRETLLNEQVEIQGQLDKIEQEWHKQNHKNALLELKAPQAGAIKDLATHTLGAVVQLGTVLMTLVPVDEKLQAEVQVKNEDIGFVHPGQKVKVKLMAYPFQKYGMVDGVVARVSADANESQGKAENDKALSNPASSATYKATVRLNTQELRLEEQQFALTPGMQVVAEINQGQRTVLEYLLSPVQGVVQEAMRER